MAVLCRQRMILSLRGCRPSSLPWAFFATVPKNCQQTSERSEPGEKREKGEKRKKEKKPKKRYNTQDLNSSWEERLSSVATPWSRISYEEQLKLKYKNIKMVLETLTSHLKALGAVCSEVTQVPDGICCPLRPVLPSPVIDGYRNKSTFSVSRGPDGNPKTVGLFVGTGKGKDIVCVRPDHLLNMPAAHLEVAQCYEKFLHQSTLDPCLLFHMGGHWREIIVRTNRKGDSMAVVTFHPQHLSPEELDAQKKHLKEFFIYGPGAVCGLTSLYFQESTMTRCSHQQSPYQLLYGEPHIFEDIMGLTFRISPDAFFQVNTSAAEVLYQTIGDLSCAKENQVLLDICCGTGAIGLSLANQVSRVVGVEVVEQAVEDARWNAALNGITNCEFHSGKAEVVLPQLLPQADGQALTAVVNPSRAGLHYRVVRTIRNCEAIRTLIYVSCKPDGEAMRNFIEYCCPVDSKKKLMGEAFTPLLAVPVDLFPHTPHCELVLVFAR